MEMISDWRYTKRDLWSEKAEGKSDSERSGEPRSETVDVKRKTEKRTQMGDL